MDGQKRKNRDCCSSDCSAADFDRPFSLQIKTVTVTGNVRYTQEQITEMLFPDKVSRNLVVCYLKDHFQEHVEIPFVQDYKIEFQGLNKVEIIVYEKV